MASLLRCTHEKPINYGINTLLGEPDERGHHSKFCSRARAPDCDERVERRDYGLARALGQTADEMNARPSPRQEVCRHPRPAANSGTRLLECST